MPAGRPYYPAYPADFFTATQGWDLDMKGPYRLIIDLLNERDRPIPDDPKFMAGVLGCSAQRWRKIREFLLDQGKLYITDDGQHLSNPRFDRDHAKRLEERQKSVDGGRLGGQISAAKRAGQTELFEENRESFQKESQKNRKSSPSHSKLSEEKSNKNNPASQPPPQGTRAGASRASPESESEEEESPPDPPAAEPPEPTPAKPDLKALMDQVCDAAGFRPTAPAQITRALDQVAQWVRDGIDFETVVFPVIARLMADSTERTRTLGRFREAVAREHEHLAAKQKAQARLGRTPPAPRKAKPPDPPLLAPADEDPMFRPIRDALLEAVGPQAFSMIYNRVRFEDCGPCHGDKRPVRVNGPPYSVEALRSHGWTRPLMAVAKPHGFTDVWF